MFRHFAINHSRCIHVPFAVLLLLLISPESFGQRIDSIPVEYVAPEIRYQQSTPRGDLNIVGLRRTRPDHYLLDSGDVLGIFIEGILGESGSSPPVHYPPPGSDLAPSIGYPIVVREDGTVSLPMIKPLYVRGTTIVQAEALVQTAYRGGDRALLRERSRILVTLMRERTVQVTVIREDNSFANRRGAMTQNRTAVNVRSDRSGRVEVVNLPAYKNDVFNALIESGGFPGVNAVPNLEVYRARPAGEVSRTIREVYHPNSAFPRSRTSSYPTSPRQTTYRPSYAPSINRTTNRLHQGDVTRLPLRGNAGISNANSILGEGDVVRVAAKPTAVFYTGGLLGGGEFLLPRDKDLNVIEAISMVGGQLGGGSIRGGTAPTELIVLRKTPGGGQVNFRVDVNQALANPSARPLVAPGDTLILRYTAAEQVLNFGLDAFRIYGTRQLFR